MPPGKAGTTDTAPLRQPNHARVNRAHHLPATFPFNRRSTRGEGAYLQNWLRLQRVSERPIYSAAVSTARIAEITERADVWLRSPVLMNPR